MKRGPTILIVLLATYGCHDITPRITEPPISRTGPPPATSLWTMVTDRDDVCIPGATLTVVRGQDSGTVVTQDSNCYIWERAGGYTFEKLTPFLPITLRASAAGYVDNEQTITPDLHDQAVLLFKLSPR